MTTADFLVNDPPAVATPKLIEAFRMIATPHISDNLARLQGLVGLRRYHRQAKLVGTAVTVRTRPS